VLIGDAERIRAHAEKLGLAELAARAEFVSATEDAAEIAVKMAREGRIDILLKGHLRTDQLFRPVLDKEKGLRTDACSGDMAFFEQRGAGGPRD